MEYGSNKIKHVLYFVGHSIDTESGKVNLSFWEEKPFGYAGIKCYNFTMTRDYLKRLLEYKQTTLEIRERYTVYTKYNPTTHSMYISSMAKYVEQ